MMVQCAWCRKSMGEIEPLSSSAVSHGICPKCLSEQMSEAKKVAPMKRNTPRKGSPEAYAWAREMKAARERKARHNPLRKSSAVWFYDASMRGWILDMGSNVPAYTIKPTGNGYRLSEVFGDNTTPILQCEELSSCMDHVDSLHKRRFKRNPGASYHAAEAEQAEAQERRAARGGKVTQAAFQRGKASAHRQSELKARELKLNPIAVFGNPGSHVQAKIEGIIYSRCIEIRAEKTHHKPGLYRHPFNKKSRAVIFGLDNGSILIQSMNGTRLWGEDSDL